jgi:Bacteriophage tail sheath protein
MPTYLTPGVYYERSDADYAVIGPLRTDVAAFVGIARRGPLDVALPINSWRQFVSHYGDFTGAGYLGYAVRGFFENGGRRCWIVRVASAAAASASVPALVQPTLVGPPPPAQQAWDVRAWSPGVWGNDIEIEWRETHHAQTAAAPLDSTPEYVTVSSVAGFERGTHIRVNAGLSIEYRAVTSVDVNRRRLYFVNPDRHERLPYERPLTGYDTSRPLPIESIEYSLLVRESGRVTAVVEKLSLVPAHPRYGPGVLAPPFAAGDNLRTPQSAAEYARRSRRDRRLDRPADEGPIAVVITEQRDASAVDLLWPLAADSLPRRLLTGGLDGLAPLSVRDFIGQPEAVLDDHETRRRKRRGLRVIEPVDEVSLVSVPDIHIQPVPPPLYSVPPPCVVDECLPPPPLPPAPTRAPAVGDLPPRFSAEQVFEAQSALIEHCERLADRFAILDPPWDAVRDPRVGIAPLRAWRRRFDSSFAALYGPWLMTPDPIAVDPGGLRAVPPSGHVCGFIADTDLRIGVHRAPANGALRWVQSTTLPLDDALHGVLNPEHVNAIRAFAGRGLRIFGARTLSSDPDWRFVNVRRLLLMLEKAIRVGTQWVVFEPNNRLTRAKLQLALTSLLLEVWRRGGLAGRTADEAFFVRCGEAENPPDATARGRLTAAIGVAPAKPFEFIIVRVGVTDNVLEISDSGLKEVPA